MNHEELDSQLSAMFDGELPEAQCELLARRLARDEGLKAKWGRYAVIGAAIRGEGGARLDIDLARRVNGSLSGERALSARPAAPRGRASRWWQPVAGVALAAGVAALSLMWLREQIPPAGTSAPRVIQNAPVAAPTLAAASSGEPDSYTVPDASESQSIVPTTTLAKYVVAHSEFSPPLSRRNLLTTLVANEAGTAEPAARSEAESSLEDASNDVE